MDSGESKFIHFPKINATMDFLFHVVLFVICCDHLKQYFPPCDMKFPTTVTSVTSKTE